MKQSRNIAGLDVDPGRPLSARSVMASLLLGRHPARASGRDLVRWCSLFDVAPGTARVALHRMTTAGELRRDGTDYELVGGLARRQEEQEASLDPAVRRWDGTWRMAVVVSGPRAAPVRADMRAALRRARLAEWREGVWIRPANIELVEDPRAEWLTVRPDAESVAFAARLFDTAHWNRDARQLLDRLDDATRRLAKDNGDAPADVDTIAPAFLAGAAALRHIRADPLLPDPLLPPDWRGPDLRGAYTAYQAQFAAVARAWFRHPAFSHRFSGLGAEEREG